MPISLLGFIVGRLVAEREQLPPDSVNRAALIGATLGSTPVGVIATTEFVRREIPPPTTAQTPSVTGGALAGTQTGGGSQMQNMQVYIPDLASTHERATKEELETAFPAQINVQVINQPSIDRLRGRVIRQSHRDVLVSYGTTVTFYLGTGSGSIYMPSVEDENLEDAQKILEKAGFDIKNNLHIEYRPTDDAKRDGLTLIQNPPKGKRVNPEKTMVTLFVEVAETPVQTELREMATNVQNVLSTTEMQQILQNLSSIVTKAEQVLSSDDAKQIGRELRAILTSAGGKQQPESAPQTRPRAQAKQEGTTGDAQQQSSS